MNFMNTFVLLFICMFGLLETVGFIQPIILQMGILTTTFIGSWLTAVWLNGKENAKNKVSPKGLAVVVAGCDSESGFLVASKLSLYGYHVFGGTQDPRSDLPKHMPRFEVDVLELQPDMDESVSAALAVVTTKLKSEERKLHALVCNIAKEGLGELEWVPERELARALDYSIVGTLRIVKAFLPLLRASKGRIVICSGLSGRVAIPGAGVHSITNAALISLADCLRREMYKFQVQVVLVEPSWIVYRTPLNEEQSAGASIKEVVCNLRADVAEDYTSQYIHAFRSLWNRRASVWYLCPPDLVTTKICQAVNDSLIRQRYTCSCKDDFVSTYVLAHLPGILTDVVQCFYYQPYVRLRLFSDEDAEDYRNATRDEPPPLIGSPGYVQKLLQASVSPDPLSTTESPSSTPERCVMYVKENTVGARLKDLGDASVAETPVELTAASSKAYRLGPDGLFSPDSQQETTIEHRPSLSGEQLSYVAGETTEAQPPECEPAADIQNVALTTMSSIADILTELV